MFAKYYSCDPLLAKRIVATDQLLPLFVMDTLGFVFLACSFRGSSAELCRPLAPV
ncbi:sodium-coupled monocarboxylate transporter 1-like [Tropilaelaps mercedesae]|uniref:Sodium-coupled monocarboxylate transporter 1-like n=1 Tax=Tropilaelaps mercedesae TaxID=418985 RepID=A0A1V9XAQ2_9ACAR|nr:sodium-coupled monocarboxylate transporter 1-like [Tropilaelaps mercedesae]